MALVLVKEDANPEPRRVLLLTFVAGMMMAMVALFVEQVAHFVNLTLLVRSFPEWLNIAHSFVFLGGN